jgi:hypothetical protein
VLASSCNAFAYESEAELSVVIIGKLAKFITWEDVQSDHFIITILNNPFKDLVDKTYRGKQVQTKDVEVKYINDIKDLGFTHILFVPEVPREEMNNIKAKVRNKNILTVSDARGFAEKGGIIQIYFAKQKTRLKINFDLSQKEHLKISSSLLSISEIVGEGK